MLLVGASCWLVPPLLSPSGNRALPNPDNNSMLQYSLGEEVDCDEGDSSVYTKVAGTILFVVVWPFIVFDMQVIRRWVCPQWTSLRVGGSRGQQAKGATAIHLYP